MHIEFCKVSLKNDGYEHRIGTLGRLLFIGMSFSEVYNCWK
jgi:hypothetical protein